MVTELSDIQKIRLETSLRGKRGAALQDAGTSFYMTYRPPFFGSARRMLSAVWGLLGIFGVTRQLLSHQADSHNSWLGWLGVAVALVLLVVCWVGFRAGGELTWTNAEARVYKKPSDKVGYPATITFDSEDASVFFVNGQRCGAAPADLDVLKSQLAR